MSEKDDHPLKQGDEVLVIVTAGTYQEKVLIFSETVFNNDEHVLITVTKKNEPCMYLVKPVSLNVWIGETDNDEEPVSVVRPGSIKE
jgi:hypothetical protein